MSTSASNTLPSYRIKQEQANSKQLHKLSGATDKDKINIEKRNWQYGIFDLSFPLAHISKDSASKVERKKGFYLLILKSPIKSLVKSMNQSCMSCHSGLFYHLHD